MTVYAALATTFALESSGRFERVLGAAYADLAVPGAAVAEHAIHVERSLTLGWRTSVDGVVRRRGMDSSAALLDVRRAVNEVAESSAIGTDAVLNASAIEIDGVVVGLVGPVVAGKSSLLLTAAKHGHGYVADDVVAVRSDGMVRPFHRPVGVRLETAEALGVRVPRGPFRDGYPFVMGDHHRLSPGGRLGLLVLARRADGLATERHSPSWGLMLLANAALRSPGRERSMFQRLGALCADVPVVSLWFDGPEPAVGAIEQFVQSLNRG